MSFTGDRFRSASGRRIVGITFESLAADAESFVIARKAIRIGSAQDSTARVDAFGLTGQTSANGGSRTVVVTDAFHRLLASFLVRFTHFALRTETFEGSARVLALGTGGAGDLSAVVDGRAALGDVTGVSGLTFAYGRVFFREAQRVLAALVVDHAGDFATIFVTFLVGRTIVVAVALDFETSDFVILRITEESVLTAAHGLVILGHAVGVATAQDGTIARIAARSLSVVALQTGLRGGTFAAAPATNFLDADAVDAQHRVGALTAVTAGRSTFALDALLRGQTVAAAGTLGGADSGHAGL